MDKSEFNANKSHSNGFVRPCHNTNLSIESISAVKVIKSDLINSSKSPNMVTSATNGYTNGRHKEYENETKSLNNYYSQLNAIAKNGYGHTTISILNQKPLNTNNNRIDNNSQNIFVATRTNTGAINTYSQSNHLMSSPPQTPPPPIPNGTYGSLNGTSNYVALPHNISDNCVSNGHLNGHSVSNGQTIMNGNNSINLMNGNKRMNGHNSIINGHNPMNGNSLPNVSSNGQSQINGQSLLSHGQGLSNGQSLLNGSSLSNGHSQINAHSLTNGHSNSNGNSGLNDMETNGLVEIVDGEYS